MLIVSFDNVTFSQTINAVISCVANAGGGFDIPNFSVFSTLSKTVLSIGMLLGRLEIYPLIVLFSDLKK